MDFNEAERRFRIIEGRYRAGEVGWEEYQAQLYQLQVTDDAGRVWMLQASTGRWYVLQDGRWQAGSPPREEGVPRPGSTPPAPPRASTPTAAAPSRRRWLLIGGASFALLACAGVIIAGVVLRPRLEAALPGVRERFGVLVPEGEGGGAPSATEEPSGSTDAQGPAPALEWAARDPLPVPADGSPVSDEAGAALQVPPDSVPDDGQAQLESYQPQGELFEALKETYVFETGFYAAAARGGDDGVGRATLRLPAAGPDSRVMAVIDGEHALMLDVEPEGGVLTLNPRLLPSDPGDAQVVDGLGQGGSLRYAVVHPRQTGREGRSGPGHAAAPHPADDVGRYCHVIYTYGSAQPHPVSGCRKNEAGTVFVSYPPELGLADEANQVADVAEVMMAKYRDHGGEGRGFPAATISRGSPLYITLVRGSGDPYYKPANGVIYLPVDLAKTITADGASSLYHEMAHWVQDEAYVMTWAFMWDDKKWWLETAAENMVMLVDPDYTAQNLTTYGTISVDGGRLDFQASPYDWRGDSYVQAQLVKLNMCDDTSVCPLSEATFKQAINEGTYPFDDAGAREKLSQNLDDYARYLLGATPERANVGILGGEPVRTGEGYGESVQVARSQRYGDFWHLRSGQEPQMTQDAAGAVEATVIDAALDKDGVYPLRVVSGYGASGGAGLPAALRVEPGAPLYYRTDDGEVTFHDGAEELVIQPIHAEMGFRTVRLVALGREGGEHLRARIELIDLSGAWVFDGEVVSHSVTCSDSIADESISFGTSPDSVADLGMSLVGMGSLLGDYAPDASGNGLTWTSVPARRTGLLAGLQVAHEGSVLVGPESVQLQAQTTLDLGGDEQSRGDGGGTGPGPPALAAMLTLGGLAPLAVVTVRGREVGRRDVLRLAVAALTVGALSVLLTGCFGIDLYGTASGEVAFKELEFIGGEETAVFGMGDDDAVEGDLVGDNEPLWLLAGGEGTVQVDITYVALTEDDEGNELRSTRRCTGPVTHDDIEAAIFKDVVFDLEE